MKDFGMKIILQDVSFYSCKLNFTDQIKSHLLEGLMLRNFCGRKMFSKIPSVIRQKGKSQNGCFKKTKHAKFSEKRTFFTP